MNTKKIVAIICFICSVTTSFQTVAQNIDYKNAINLSGKQRMLTQKMTKAYLLMASGMNDTKIKNELNFSKLIFEKQLSILKKHPSYSATKANLDKVEQLWADFSTTLTASPSNENAKKLVSSNTELLKTCDAVVTNIKDALSKSGGSNANLEALAATINKSGKQRMLSQRMCLYFTALKSYPDAAKSYKTILSDVFSQFSKAKDELANSTYNTPAITAEIKAASEIWNTYTANKDAFLKGSSNLNDVYTHTNQLTKLFDKVTGLYEVSGSEVVAAAR